MASLVDMEEEAKMEYIVDGIVDEENNKCTLYGAMSIKALRKRLIMYEEQKCRRAKSIKIENKKPSQSGDAVKKTRCYNCGDKEHMSVNCPNKSRGPKCFKCRGYGHIASKCDNLSESPKEVCSAWRLLHMKCGKGVKIAFLEISN